MKRNIKKGILFFLIGYLLLFSIKIIYSFMEITNTDTLLSSGGTDNSVIMGKESFKRNYAGDTIIVKDKITKKTVTVDQKYERIADIKSMSGQFNQDCKKIRELIKSEQGVVQYENNSGVKKNRTLNLSIGVHPDKFDGFVENVKNIAILHEFEVIKTDKTSEYKSLNASIKSLLEKKEALINLKTMKDAKTNDLINLEEKIFKINEEILNYGVQLGEYNIENELCTVKLALIERKNINIELNLLNILKIILISFAWSVGIYIAFLIVIILTVLCSYLMLLLINKFKEVYKSIMK